MQKKKKQAKTKKLGIDPTLKPIVVNTSHMANKEEQEDNPLGRMAMKDAEKRAYPHKPGLESDLPEGFKTAEKITKIDELEHEIGRLRSYLESFSKEVTIEGKIHFIQVDPLNMTVKLLGKT